MSTLNFDVKLSANFNLSEFLKSDTAKKKRFTEQFYPDYLIIENLEKLCSNVLQPLRNRIGCVKINSGYRCERLNIKLNGSLTSQHMKGCAADIVVADKNFAIDFIKTLEFDQLIIYPTFLHISYELPKLRKQIIYK